MKNKIFQKFKNISQIKRLGFLFLLIAFIVLISSYCQYRNLPIIYILRRFFDEFHEGLFIELLSISISIFVINRIYKDEESRFEKKILRAQMSSNNNDFAREAIRRLRLRGWFDEIIADIKEGELVGADLSNENFNGYDLSEIDLSEATLNNASFVITILNDANLYKSKLSNADLTGASLIKANLSNAVLTSAFFTNADLTGANLSLANLSLTDLTGADLSFCNFRGCNLGDAIGISKKWLLVWEIQNKNYKKRYIKPKDLSNSDLEESYLAKVDLTCVIFENAKLHKAIIIGSDLTEAIFNGADLRDVDFSESDLTRAKLQNLDLLSTKFHNADLTGADLTSSRIDETQLEHTAKSLYHTIMPDGRRHQ